jgi:bifunctional non-homologous end joining protein LigD
MLARLGQLPRDERRWGFEVKWDGVRAIAYSDHGHWELVGRNGTDFSSRYPELRELSRLQGARRLVLDGEVVALDDEGRPSFERMQQRMHLASDSAVRRRMRDLPVTYMIFDLLYLDGHHTLALPYEQRRELLEALDLSGPAWRTPAYQRGEGTALLDATRRMGVEGIVAKRLDSSYEAGRRSSAWVKVKNVCSTDVVVGGWLPGEGGRSGRLGALVVGIADDDGVLRYAGRVGTGFTQAELVRLGGLLDGLARDDSPFAGRQPPKQTRFVEPQLVARVDYSERTQAGTLRQPSYKGLRDDVPPEDVRLS